MTFLWWSYKNGHRNNPLEKDIENTSNSTVMCPKYEFMALHFLTVFENHEVFLLVITTYPGAVCCLQTFELQYIILAGFCQKVEWNKIVFWYYWWYLRYDFKEIPKIVKFGPIIETLEPGSDEILPKQIVYVTSSSVCSHLQSLASDKFRISLSLQG